MASRGLYIPPEILADNQIGPTQKMVYAVMVEAAEGDGFIRMKSEEIGERTGMTRNAAMQNRNVLQKLGYIAHIDRTSYNYRIIKWPGGDGNGGAGIPQRSGIRGDVWIHTNRNEPVDRAGSNRTPPGSREFGADGNGHDEDCPVQHGKP